MRKLFRLSYQTPVFYVHITNKPFPYTKRGTYLQAISLSVATYFIRYNYKISNFEGDWFVPRSPLTAANLVDIIFDVKQLFDVSLIE